VSSIARVIGWLRQLDKLSDKERLDRFPSTEDERYRDWIAARACWWQQVLLSGIPAFSSFQESALSDIALIWLDDIKEFIAYQMWYACRPTHGIWNTESQKEALYLEGCHKIHDWLTSASIKYKNPHSEFVVAKQYIQTHFLKPGGEIDLDAEETEIAVRRKAERMREVGRSISEPQNKAAAQDYVKNFYENIIPAVEGAKTNAVESVLEVLRDDYHTKKQSLLVNAFETDLAIRFLKRENILEFENKAASPTF
jgi:hypothetical protein